MSTGVAATRPASCAFWMSRGDVKAQEFRKDWAEIFDAPGQELWWTGLPGPPRPHGPARRP